MGPNAKRSRPRRVQDVLSEHDFVAIHERMNNGEDVEEVHRDYPQVSKTSLYRIKTRSLDPYGIWGPPKTTHGTPPGKDRGRPGPRALKKDKPRRTKHRTELIQFLNEIHRDWPKMAKLIDRLVSDVDKLLDMQKRLDQLFGR